MECHVHPAPLLPAVGAVGNNGLGVTGVAWNINLYICRAETPGEGLYFDAIYDCYSLCASTVRAAWRAGPGALYWGLGGPGKLVLSQPWEQGQQNVCEAAEARNPAHLRC